MNPMQLMPTHLPFASEGLPIFADSAIAEVSLTALILASTAAYLVWLVKRKL